MQDCGVNQGAYGPEPSRRRDEDESARGLNTDNNNGGGLNILIWVTIYLTD